MKSKSTRHTFVPCCGSLLAAFAGIMLATSNANAALLASYVDGTAVNAAAFTNLITTIGYTATSLTDVGLTTSTASTYGGNNLPAGPTAGSSAASQWLSITAGNLDNTTTPVSTAEYFGFTVTGTGGNTIDPSSLNFDWVLATGTSATGGITAYYQLFAAADGGSFVSVGSVGSISGPSYI